MINRLQLPFEYDKEYYDEIVSLLDMGKISFNVWEKCESIKFINDNILFSIVEIIEESVK